MNEGHNANVSKAINPSLMVLHDERSVANTGVAWFPTVGISARWNVQMSSNFKGSKVASELVNECKHS